MNIEVTARHLDVPEDVREYAIEKVNKVNRIFENPISCHIILSHENGLHSTEISLTVSGKQLFVKETSSNLLKSLDGAVDKLITRVKKFKTKRYGHT